MKRERFIYLLFLILGINAVHAVDWPRWRGPHRNGITEETEWNPKALENGANILWEADIGDGYSAVTVKGTCVFATGSQQENRANVFCFQATTGQEIWRFSYDCPCPNGCFKTFRGPRSTPIWDDGRIYTLSDQGQLYCLNATDGKVIWHKDLVNTYDANRPKYGFCGSPVIEGSLLVLNACESGLVLDKKTGDKIWSSPGGRASYSTPVIFSNDGRRCVIVFARQMIVCRDLKTGKELWRHPWPYVNNDGAASADPVVVGTNVFISSGYRKGAAVIEFAKNRPRQRWFNKEIKTEFGTAVYVDGYLFAPDGDTRHPTAYLKCVDMRNGKIIWTRDTGHCSIIRANGTFILLNQWGELTIMEASHEGYKDLSHAKIVETSKKVRCWTAPVLANGLIYIRTNRGHLVCVDMR